MPVMTEEAKARKKERDKEWIRRDRRRSSPAMRHVQQIPTHETAGARDRCRICGELIWFDVEPLTGRLLRFDPGGLNHHRHQEG